LPDDGPTVGESIQRENRAIAIANNDVVILSWRYKKKIPNCLGFAIHRIDIHSQLRRSLPAWVGFKGEHDGGRKISTTDKWPVQKFWWRDHTVIGRSFYQYEIVPMVKRSTRRRLEPLKNLTLLTNPIQLSPYYGSISVFFNKGILAAQWVGRWLPRDGNGKPSHIRLLGRVDQPGDPLRDRLSGELRLALMRLIQKARREGGQCYCALYELSDPELLQILIGAPFIHIVLSNTGRDDEVNLPARQTLDQSGIDLTNRMLRTNHIGHNKFVVYVNNQGQPEAVLTGSTNWTASALCGQTNNAIIINSREIASGFLNYWNRLKADNSEQAAALRQQNEMGPIQLTLDNGTQIKLWFSPNTKAKGKPKTNPKTPVDMQEVFGLIEHAKSAILFLLFQPGKPSILEQIRKKERSNPDLFIAGAATDQKAVEDYKTSLFHRTTVTSESVEPEVYTTRRDSESVVAAAAIEDQFAFWQAELLKLSPMNHAIIHDKIVVIDPFSNDCAVVTGSHNLGFKASYSNDENMIIIRKNRAVAQAYTAHIMHVYDHYRFRYKIQKEKRAAFNGLEKEDTWQNKYFNPNHNARKEFIFWGSANPVEATYLNT
jgi:phosphatidylserine/phosphatidylglycerophosphate/cardiolipin synthase-like enzyme